MNAMSTAGRPYAGRPQFGRARPANAVQQTGAPWGPLLACAAVVVVVVTAAVYLILRWMAPAPSAVVTFRLGEAIVSVPRAALRRPSHRLEAASDRIDLAYAWPLMMPAGGDAVPVALPALVRISLTAADSAPDPRERASGLYARFLDAGVTPVEAGLQRRSFRADSPFAGEILMMSPPDGRAFAARCPDAVGSLGAGSCFFLMRRGNVEAQVMLDHSLIAQWADLSRSVETLLGTLVPPASAAR